mmetsp:Transcript_32498/g.49000  ORF Transcript_32498/g.49000 Transcript_32498/m.49000 type:complete len:199 (+) Transcript_32498:100-696(+)
MKTSLALVAAFTAGVSAFAPAATSSKSATSLKSVFDKYEGAIDFRCKKFEFDPLKLSETYSPWVPFFREAELRHGRTAMLAVLGYIAADSFRLPGEMYSFENVPRAVDAHDALVANGPNLQVVAWVGLFDLVITAPAIGALNEGREPGDFGWTTFAPESAEGFKKKRESELLNGRLAMIAIGGIATQTVLSGHGFPYV